MPNVPDIYFLPEYGRLYERHENGKLESFSYKAARGEVYFQFIRRPLRDYKGFEAYSDIITPYGYGGPIFLQADDGDKKTLASEFGKAFGEYCLENRIVSAFVRFHPILGNALDFKESFDSVEAIRKTIAIDLTKNLLYEEFEKITRRHYQSALNGPLTVQYDALGKTMDAFIDLYYQLMDQKQTSSYYYFPREYFDELMALDGCFELVNALLDGELVASALFLKYGGFVHTHLSASTMAGNAHRAAEFINTSMALSAKERGFRWNHLGGGFSNDPEDSLLRFKMKFSKTAPFDFYVGKSIYEPRVYEALCALSAAGEKQVDDSYFPKYRAGKQNVDDER